MYNKRELKIKIVYTEAMNTTKSEVFVKLQHENCYSVVGDAPLLGAEIWFWRDFSCGRGISKFSGGQWGRHPSLPSTY